ncbi:MAG: MerR family transcriptional regulator [Gallionellaceae bacterium]|nr:MAG: MerR family transcriptional regulator [Gallionellaceae bacterium]
MLLKVGELAKRCGLTVRTLHHYDTIGLLTPSARSDSGYRLYNRNDIARLHQIQALRRFGLALADIGAVLANPGSHLAAIVDQQIRMLEQQIAQSTALRDRLSQLQGQLQRGEEPELADWLTTLEMMTMYDKYFTKEEQKSFPLLSTAENTTTAEWAELVQAVREAMEMKVPPQSPGAQTLAKRWMTMLMRDSKGDPRLLAKLNRMHFNEPSVQAQTGITLDMIAFVQQAYAETKFAIYEKYLSPEEMAFMRANYVSGTSEFPALVAEVYQHLEDGIAPDDPRMRQLTLRWMGLVRAYAGDDPATQAKLREAMAQHPELLEGSGIDARLLGYVRQAMASLRPH